MKVDPRFTKNAGQEIFTGNELLVKGALEADGGVHLLTGYPGSPIAGFFDALEAINPLLNEQGIVGRIANNEALAVAMVNGAQMAQCRAMAVMKSVGAHVASDALALGVLAGTHGDSGGLVVIGDDPWSESTQVPADSRFLAEHLRMPTIEPCCPQEVKDWVNAGFKLGKSGQIYMAILLTTALADGGGTVECYPNQFPVLNEHKKKTLSYRGDIEPLLDQTLLLPPRTWQRELELEQRFTAVKKAASELGINRIFNRPQKDELVPLGFIASGSAYAYLAHSLGEMGLAGRLPILRLGMCYPVDEQLVLEFARQCQQVVVVEERRSFIEREVLQILNVQPPSNRPDTEVYGKRFPRGLAGIPATRGLNPSLLIELLVPLVKDHPTLPNELTNGRLTVELERIQQTAKFPINIPNRTPTFCPGCPHRDSSSVLLQLRQDLLDPVYMLRTHKRKPVDLICHGDTGCYTMLMFEPTKPLMHNYSGMGLGGGTGSGVDPFIDNKQIVFMGDGTFFHSGQIAMSHSIAAGQDITYIILDNKITAMTGHQANPGDTVDLMGRPTFAQDIERIIQGMIPKELVKDVRIVRIDPTDRTRYRKLLEQTILADGIKIVIADKECGITYQRRARKEENQLLKQVGFLPKKTHMNVATEVCEFCLECTNQTGCPGLKTVDTDYGPKIQTDFSWCVNDGACQRIQVCPAFEQVTILRKDSPRRGDEHVDLKELPEPTPIHAHQDNWRCYLAGVGGMGIGLCTAILVTAGHEMGYHVQFLDKKGLAIRNGGVFSQLVFSRSRPSGDTVHRMSTTRVHDPTPRDVSFTTPLIPYGKADLLLGVDLLESCRAIDPKYPHRIATPGRTVAVVNTAKTPTILTLMGRDDFDPGQLQQTLEQAIRPGHCFGFNVGDLCERVLDSKQYANIMMLGIAFQKGYLPLKRQTIEHAIRTVIRDQTDRNLRAFNIGRKIVLRPDLFVVELKHEFESARQALRRRLNMIRSRYRGNRGKRLAKQFRVLMKQTFRATHGQRMDDPLLRDVVVRAYDCFVWGGIEYAKRYCHRLVDVFMKDMAQENYAVTRSVVWNLAKVLLIKDELYVAAMVTSPEKYKRDRLRYNVNPALGDKMTYSHYNVPEIELFGRTFRLPPIKTSDWQHRILRNARFLRPLLFPHTRETDFRNWFESVVDLFEPRDRADYQRWLAILSAPEQITGFREVRYPKMEAARRRIERLLAIDPTTFQPANEPGTTPSEDRTISLPVVTTGV